MMSQGSKCDLKIGRSCIKYSLALLDWRDEPLWLDFLTAAASPENKTRLSLCQNEKLHWDGTC